MKPTVDMVVTGLLAQGYLDYGGSSVFRLLVHKKTHQVIKVYYDNYEDPNYIVVRESVEGTED
jgi:hypothetical protein